MASALNDLEETHFTAQKVFVFDIPKPAAGTLGYRAADWPKTAIWTGRLRVASKGEKLFVLLEHTDKDGLFASCPLTGPNVVEKVTDSSRYFALRLSDGKGRHAVIGLGFQEREQAFDFKVAIQDFENRNKAPTEAPAEAPTDFSLPQGGKIHVNLPGAKETKEGKKKEANQAASVPALAAPPGPKKGKDKKEDEGKSEAQSITADIFGFDKLQIEGKPKTNAQFTGSNSQTVQAQSVQSQSQANVKVTTAGSTPSEWVTFT
jgi:serine/threonine kinase 38